MDDSVKRRIGETIQGFEERAILSRRRAVIFIFFIGLLVVMLMFLIRIDIENNQLGMTMRVVEKTSPVFLGTIKTALANDKEITEEEMSGDRGNESTAYYFQRHPRELLKRLFG